MQNGYRVSASLIAATLRCSAPSWGPFRPAVARVGSMREPITDALSTCPGRLQGHKPIGPLLQGDLMPEDRGKPCMRPKPGTVAP